MLNYYTVFDLENKRVGFGRSHHVDRISYWQDYVYVSLALLILFSVTAFLYSCFQEKRQGVSPDVSKKKAKVTSSSSGGDQSSLSLESDIDEAAMGTLRSHYDPVILGAGVITSQRGSLEMVNLSRHHNNRSIDDDFGASAGSGSLTSRSAGASPNIQPKRNTYVGHDSTPVNIFGRVEKV
jgi:hypothetical protein